MKSVGPSSGRGAAPRLTFEQLDRLRDQYGRMGWPAPSDADSERMCMKLHERLVQDPLVKRYVHHLDLALHGGDNRNREPWQAVAEQRYAALLCAAAVRPESSGIRFVNTRFSDERGEPLSNAFIASATALRMLMAQPYLWSNEIDHLVRASPLPKHVVDRRILPHPSVFFSYESALNLRGVRGMEGFDLSSDWTLLEDQVGGLNVMTNVTTLDAQDRDQSTSLIAQGLMYGSTYPDDFEPGPEREAVGLILRRLAFLRSPYVVTDTHRLPRPIRRELQRVDAPSPEPLVHTVRLRRIEQPSPRPDSDDENERPDRDWNHHWWVTGHYRAQWMPSTQSHNVIWIAPYVKGPLEKPLLEKVYHVMR
jgi:hypothetical protein